MPTFDKVFVQGPMTCIDIMNPVTPRAFGLPVAVWAALLASHCLGAAVALILI